ncbi:hypothetical protein JAAARDRAFT_188247 [Jaapia argillacea MUCL 33604]|uniref:Uncharacterized protein n=1 Tax=Jaapia argillacea MUCL 33604 TaxID=933084 RepID=A0A067QN64_9AGAM|nr:hypothetical protein JAAARDRAFT_188247 [Jaapia argillacea MUCL 33604]
MPLTPFGSAGFITPQVGTLGMNRRGQDGMDYQSYRGDGGAPSSSKQQRPQLATSMSHASLPSRSGHSRSNNGSWGPNSVYPTTPSSALTQSSSSFESFADSEYAHQRIRSPSMQSMSAYPDPPRRSTDTGHSFTSFRSESARGQRWLRHLIVTSANSSSTSLSRKLSNTSLHPSNASHTSLSLRPTASRTSLSYGPPTSSPTTRNTPTQSSTSLAAPHHSTQSLPLTPKSHTKSSETSTSSKANRRPLPQIPQPPPKVSRFARFIRPLPMPSSTPAKELSSSSRKAQRPLPQPPSSSSRSDLVPGHAPLAGRTPEEEYINWEAIEDQMVFAIPEEAVELEDDWDA